MPRRMTATSMSDLSEIKQLLLSLTSDLQAVKSDLAELKKNQQGQSQNQSHGEREGRSFACASCAREAASPSSGASPAPGNAEGRSTPSSVSQFIEQEAAKGKVVEKVVAKAEGTVDGELDAHGRKRSRSAADLDIPGEEGADGADSDVEIVAEKRVKQQQQQQPEEKESKSNADEDSDEDEFGPWGEGGTRDEETVLDLAVWDGIHAVDKLLSRDSEISIPWLFMAIEGVHARWLDQDAKRRRLCWREYQKEGMLEFEYCLYGIFYRGHKHPDVARGKCFCRRDDALPGLINYAAQCIRVKRSERDGGKLAFRFGRQIGHRRDPYCWEVGLHWK